MTFMIRGLGWFGGLGDVGGSRRAFIVALCDFSIGLWVFGGQRKELRACLNYTLFKSSQSCFTEYEHSHIQINFPFHAASPFRK